MTAIETPILLPYVPPAAPPVAPSDQNTNLVIRPRSQRLRGPLLSGLAAWLTCGLLPLGLWLVQWKRVLRQDRSASASAEAPSLLLRLAVFLLALLAAEGGWMLAQGMPIAQIRQALLHHGLLVRYDHHARFVPLRLPAFWSGALLLAYTCYWAAVRMHVRRQTLLTGGTSLRTGLRWSWVMGAGVFGAAHLWWGIPMMLAGAQQQHYLSRTHLRLRRPTALAVCRNRRCTAPLPVGAAYCPRCGTTLDSQRT